MRRRIAARMRRAARRARPFVHATVVRAQEPTSAQRRRRRGHPGRRLDRGFRRRPVRREFGAHGRARRAARTARRVLLRVLPDGERAVPGVAGRAGGGQPVPVRRRDGDLPAADAAGPRWSWSSAARRSADALAELAGPLGYCRLRGRWPGGGRRARPRSWSPASAGTRTTAIRAALDAGVGVRRAGGQPAARRGGARRAGPHRRRERARVHTPAGLDIGARTAAGDRAVHPGRGDRAAAVRPTGRRRPAGRGRRRRRCRRAADRDRPGLRDDRAGQAGHPAPDARRRRVLVLRAGLPGPLLQPACWGADERARERAGRARSDESRRPGACARPSVRGAGPVRRRGRPSGAGSTRSTTSSTTAWPRRCSWRSTPRPAAAAGGRARASARPRRPRRWPRALDTPLIRLQCYEGLTVGEALYEWNYQRQLLAIRLAEARGDDGCTTPTCSPRSSCRNGRSCAACGTRGPEPPVLLIDEIDRADDEFEALLFEFLGEARGHHPGARHVHRRPAAGRGAHLQPQPGPARRAAPALPLPLDRLPGPGPGRRDRAAPGAGPRTSR